MTGKIRAGKTPSKTMSGHPRVAPGMTLTEAVRRVFVCQSRRPGKYGLFSVSGGLTICHAESGRFALLRKKRPESLIGVYDRKVRITDLVDDLKCFFSDENEQ